MSTETYRLEHLQVSSGTGMTPTASVRIAVEGGEVEESAAMGDGPVDATFHAINNVVRLECELKEFRVQEVTEGIAALGEVNVRVRRGPHIASGHGADTDILVAAARAYLNALNKLVELGDTKKMTPETSSGAPAAAAATV
jgi:2-isopropylmalate synthase